MFCPVDVFMSNVGTKKSYLEKSVPNISDTCLQTGEYVVSDDATNAYRKK
jgi:hypothetical protein